MAYYENPGQVNDEAISIAGGRTFQVIQLADSEGNIINPAAGDIVLNGDVVIGTEIEISNDVGNPVPVQSDALGEPDDSVATTDTGTFSLLALVKRALQGITSIVGYVDGVEGSLTSVNGKLPTLSSGRIPVDIGAISLGDVEIKNDAGNPVPVSTDVQKGSGAVTSTTTRVTLATDGPGVANLASIAGLSIPAHDYIALSYTGTNLTGVQYRTGGASGTIVGTLTLAYSGSNLISVTKS